MKTWRNSVSSVPVCCSVLLRHRNPEFMSLDMVAPRIGDR